MEGTGFARSLDEQIIEYRHSRFLAMPLAGTIMWSLIALTSFFASPVQIVWILFIATGSTAYLGIFLSKFTGENFTDKSKPKNDFNSLFLCTVFMALLVYAIAIPFFIIDYTSLPLTVGILAGLMWLPFSWAIQHWAGTFHAVARTLLVLGAWYVFPEHRFLAIPVVIVIVYVVTIIALERRWKNQLTRAT